MTTLPWYIDPDRLNTPLSLTEHEQHVVTAYSRASTGLIADPNGAERVINRFRENGPEMIAEINRLKPSLVVDLACGMNPYRGLIHNLVSTDITPHPYVDYICDFKATPFRDSVADVILLQNGYAFYQHNRAVFREIGRIARPGCRVYCRTSNRVFVRDLKTIDSPGYIRRFTRALGWEFIKPVSTATWSDPEDRGVYFDGCAKPTGDPSRVRLVWTWRVVKHS